MRHNTTIDSVYHRVPLFIQLAHGWSGRALLLLALAIIVWIWWGRPPDLINANAPTAAIEQAQMTLNRRANDRLLAEATASVLDGPRGDFEKRGEMLPHLPAHQRSIAAAALAADARLLEDVANAAQAERSALQAYEAALMARSRDLGPLAEMLRSATWPIVEHLKLYPPPLGTRADWSPPDGQFFNNRAQAIEQGDLNSQVQAARDIGHATYSLKQLRALDTTYRAELDRYHAQLLQVSTAGEPPVPLIRVILAIFGTMVLTSLFLVSSTILTDGRPDGWLILGIAALLLWYLPRSLPLALIGAALLVVALAQRPALIAYLPLAAIPFYYRPRLIGPLSFPLNETLFGLTGLGLISLFAWKIRYGVQTRSIRFRTIRHDEQMLLWLIGGLILASIISFAAPPLADIRAAARELRRTIIEPAIWAGITFILLRRSIIAPRQLLWAFLLPAAVIASDSLIGFMLGRGIWATSGVPRLIGILPSSTALGIYLGAAFAGGLTFALSASTTNERVAASLLCLPLMCGVILTFTRGAWIACACVLTMVLLIQERWRLLSGLLTSGAAILAIAIRTEPTLVARMLRLGEGTGAARQEIWQAAWRAIQDSPLLGLGLDQFSHVDPIRYGIPQVRFLTLSHPHNLLLDIWLQLGGLGVIVIACLIGSTLRYLWRMRLQPIALAAFAIMTDLIIHGLLDQTLLGGDLIYLWWAIVLIALDVSNQEKETIK